MSTLSAQIVDATYDYRFLTAPQFARLFDLPAGRAQMILKQLVEAGHIAAIRRPVLDRNTPDTIYALAQRGANLIAASRDIDRRLVRWRKYHNYVGLPFVEHHLAINDVRIGFTVGARRLGHQLQEWRYEVPIKEDVDDPDERVPPLVLRPDAYALWAAGPKRLHLFFEVDMVTETHARFAQKVRRYLAYKASGFFRSRFGGRSFRMLTLAPTASRVRSLKRVAEEEGAQRAFWFAALNDVSPNQINEPVWLLAGEEAPAALLGRMEEWVA